MKNDGVTILQIVITVLIMLIIMAVTIMYGQGVTKEAKIVTIYNEIKEIESSLKEAYILNEMKISGDSLRIFDEISVPKKSAAEYTTVLGAGATGEYYYLDFTSSRKLESILELENVDNDYLFDLKNLNIYLIKGLDITETVMVGTEEQVLDVIKYNSDEIADYYNNTFVN